MILKRAEELFSDNAILQQVRLLKLPCVLYHLVYCIF
jgi:hypothetical protein